MMLVPSHSIMGTFHERLPGYGFLAQAVEADVAMQVASMIVAVRMRDDQRLMTGKELLGKLNSNGLHSFGGQAVFIAVAWVEADNVVMRFHIFALLILLILVIQLMALCIEGERIAVQPCLNVLPAHNHLPLVIQDWFASNRVMLKQQVSLDFAIVTVPDCDMLQNSYGTHHPYVRHHTSSYRAKKDSQSAAFLFLV